MIQTTVKGETPMKRFIIAMWLIGLAHTSQAAFTDNGTFLSDSSSGLDWLDVTASINRSYNDVSSEFGLGGDFEGWQYASGTQFETLVSNWVLYTINPAPTPTIHADGEITGLIAALGATDWGTGWAYTDGMIDEHNHAAVVWRARLSDNNIMGSEEEKTSPRWASGGLAGSGADVGSFLVRTSVVPIPAAVWLFGSGLLGLIGYSKRKKVA